MSGCLHLLYPCHDPLAHWPSRTHIGPPCTLPPLSQRLSASVRVPRPCCDPVPGPPALIFGNGCARTAPQAGLTCPPRSHTPGACSLACMHCSWPGLSSPHGCVLLASAEMLAAHAHARCLPLPPHNSPAPALLPPVHMRIFTSLRVALLPPLGRTHTHAACTRICDPPSTAAPGRLTAMPAAPLAHTHTRGPCC